MILENFSDADKATILYNFTSGILKCHQVLQELASETKDTVLKQQIEERIWYETESIRRFRENAEGRFVYVVYEYIEELNDNYPCGFFRDCEPAVLYGKKVAKSRKFEIQKQEIIFGNNLPKQCCEWRINPNLCPELARDEKNTEKEYDGSPIGVMRYEAGELTYIFTHEMTIEEQDKVDEYQTSRFESRFVAVSPYPFERGDYVKFMGDGSIGIVETGSEEYQYWVNRFKEGVYLDFIDSSVQVEFLDETGFHHEHIHPVCLELIREEEIKENQELWRVARAMILGEGTLDSFLFLLEEYKNSRRK